MTDDIPAVRPGCAPLTNMALAAKAALDVMNAQNLSSRIALFTGPAGYGKTMAGGHLAANDEIRGAYFRPHSVWTSKTLVTRIANELGIAKIAKTTADILDQVIEELNYNPRLLIFDEMEHLVKKKLIEILRDILDDTTVPMMMIGEPTLPAELKQWDRVDSRILVRAVAHPASSADALMLRDHFTQAGMISDELAEHFRVACGGVTRRIVVNLVEAQRVAINEGIDCMTRESWGGRPIETGHVATAKSRRR